MKNAHRGWALAAGFLLCSGFAVAEKRIGGDGVSGMYGNLNLESKKPKETYSEVTKICAEMHAVISSFNSYSNSRGGVQVSAQIQIDMDKAGELITKLAALGEVKNQSLSPNYGQTPEQLREQLDLLSKELKEIPGSRFSALVTLGLNQRQSLQSQLRQAETNQKMSTLNLSIQEPGADQPAAGSRSCPLGSHGGFSAAAGLMIGFLAAWMFFGSRKPA